jgi:hypothetical protein
MPSAGDFLRALWGDTQGVAELTLIDHSGIRPFGFQYPGDLDGLLKAAELHAQRTNVYMGVCIKKPGTKIGGRVRGKAADAACANAVWIEIDFKKHDEATTRKVFREFPLRPSIVVRSGGGIHVYWLLAEPSTDLATVYATNEALATALGGDHQSKDMARVLRVPGTTNHKYSPPRPVEITYFKPDDRYNLSDFDFLNVQTQAPQASGQQAKDEPTLGLPGKLHELLVKWLSAIWVEGHRHQLAMYTSGMLAHAGFSEAAAKAIIKEVSDSRQGDTDKRLKDVEDTYRRFAESKTVAGRPALEKMLKRNFDPLIQPNIHKCYTEIMKSIKRVRREAGGLVNFDIQRLIKFDSRPAQYRAVIALPGGEIINVDCDTEVLLRFSSFQQAAFEQNDTMIYCKPSKWAAILGSTEIDNQPAPREASAMGAVEVCFERFIGMRRENADAGTLTSLPGYDGAETFFRTAALRRMLRDEGVTIKPERLCQFLRAQGFESGSKRLDKDRVVWCWRRIDTAKPTNGTHVEGDSEDGF